MTKTTPSYAVAVRKAEEQYDTELSALQRGAIAARLDRQEAEQKASIATSRERTILTEAAGPDSPHTGADLSDAAGAVRLTQVRLTATQQAEEAAVRRLDGRSDDTHLAEAVKALADHTFPNMPVLVTYNPNPPAPPEEQRPAAVIVQKHAGKITPSGQVSGKAELRFYRSAWTTPLTKEKVRGFFPDRANDTRVSVATLLERGDHDIVRLDVLAAPPGLAVFGAVNVDTARKALGFEIEDLLRATFHSVTDQISNGQNSRVRYSVSDGKVESERVEGNLRRTTVSARLSAHFFGSPDNDADRERAERIAKSLKGRFLPGVGKIVSIGVEVIPATTSTVPGYVPVKSSQGVAVRVTATVDSLTQAEQVVEVQEQVEKPSAA